VDNNIYYIYMPGKKSRRKVATNKKSRRIRQKESRRQVGVEKREVQLASKRFLRLLKDAEKTRCSVPGMDHARKLWKLAGKEAKRGSTCKSSAYKMAAIIIGASYIPVESRFDKGKLVDTPLGPFLSDVNNLVKFDHPVTKIPRENIRLNRYERRREKSRKKKKAVKVFNYWCES